jgi:hypothetical protein
MRYVLVPEEAEMKNYLGEPIYWVEKQGEGQVPMPNFSLHRYLMVCVINATRVIRRSPEGQPIEVESKIGTGYSGTRRMAKLDRLFAKAKPGTYVGVEDEDYQVVCKIIEEIEWNPPSTGRCFADIQEAWMDASVATPAILKSVQDIGGKG